MNIWDNYYTSNYDLDEIQELTEVIKYTVELGLEEGNIEKL